MEKQPGEKAKAGPIRDPATPAAGVADGNPITDDIDLDVDVDGVVSAFGGVICTPGEDRVATEEEILGIMLGGDAGVVTKAEKEIGYTPPKH